MAKQVRELKELAVRLDAAGRPLDGNEMTTDGLYYFVPFDAEGRPIPDEPGVYARKMTQAQMEEFLTRAKMYETWDEKGGAYLSEDVAPVEALVNNRANIVHADLQAKLDSEAARAARKEDKLSFFKANKTGIVRSLKAIRVREAPGLIWFNSKKFEQDALVNQQIESVERLDFENGHALELIPDGGELAWIKPGLAEPVTLWTKAEGWNDRLLVNVEFSRVKTASGGGNLRHMVWEAGMWGLYDVADAKADSENAVQQSYENAAKQSLIDDKIDKEIQDREAADAAEVSDRNAAIETAKNELNAALAAEQTARETADVTEVSERNAAIEAAKTELNGIIETEAEARLAQDISGLGFDPETDRLYITKGDGSTAEVSLTPLVDKIAEAIGAEGERLDADIALLKERIEALETA